MFALGACPAAESASILPQQFIHYYSSSGGHIQRMLNSQHGDPDMRIAQPAEIGMNAFHLVAKHNAHGKIRLPVEQVDGMQARLNGSNLLPRIHQFPPTPPPPSLLLPPHPLPA